MLALVFLARLVEVGIEELAGDIDDSAIVPRSGRD
jgi:hypothetical protein